MPDGAHGNARAGELFFEKAAKLYEVQTPSA